MNLERADKFIADGLFHVFWFLVAYFVHILKTLLMIIDGLIMCIMFAVFAVIPIKRLTKMSLFFKIKE
jgi:hypothetical protein